jgi:MFS family permease
LPTLELTTHTDAEGARAILEPRDDIVAERATGDGSFVLADGPFWEWARSVDVDPPDAQGGVTVHQRVSWRLAVPVWGVVFRPLVRRAVRTPPAAGESPWWMTPNRFDAPTASALALLCVLSYFAGYLGTLLTQTNTFAGDQFGSTDGQLSQMLAATQVAALLALGVAALADRQGRRRWLVASITVACVITATGALAPTLLTLGISQTFARTFSTGAALLIGVYSAETVPAGSRAFAVSVLAMTAALGAGMCVILLPLADLSIGSWRWLYVVPLLALLPLAKIRRHLPETRRFTAHETPEQHQAHTGPGPLTAERLRHRRRFVLLSVSALCLALFVTPANQLLNEFLRDERGFNATQIALFTVLTNTPGGIGIVVGGKLADRRGRRPVGAIALIGGVGCTVAMFLASGVGIWAWSVVGALVGAAAVPALGVYGPELFPTANRTSANAGLNVARVGGAVAGLLMAGWLAETLSGGLPTAMAMLAIGPAVVAVLVLVAYPETASRELEDLNPEDLNIASDHLDVRPAGPEHPETTP